MTPEEKEKINALAVKIADDLFAQKELSPLLILAALCAEVGRRIEPVLQNPTVKGRPS